MLHRNVTASTSTTANYLLFEAAFPTEGGWIGDEPDESNPAGRELIEFLLAVVSPTANPADIWDEEGYGWAFNTIISGIHVNVLVQRLDYWLVIVQEVSLKPRFLRGPQYRTAVLQVCQAICDAAQGDPRFSQFRALTCAEHAAFERAQAERVRH